MPIVNFGSSLFEPVFNCTEITFLWLEHRRRIHNLLCMIPSWMFGCNENALIYINQLSPSVLRPDIALFCYAAHS
jgi:hypothetical protein